MARVKNPQHTVRIGIVGKYVELPDAYKSLNEALIHGGIANEAQGRAGLHRRRGDRGRQLAARDLRGRRPAGAGRLRRARHRGEDRRDPLRPRAPGAVLRHLPRPAVHDDRVRAQRLRHRGRDLDRVRRRDRAAGDLQAARPAGRRGDGRHDAARRLPVPAAGGHAGAPRSTATAEICERHRHRYEVNQKYLDDAAASTAWWSRACRPDGKFVEMVELRDHPWFLGCQFHPEYKSKPTEPHPLFVSFIARGARRAGAARGASAAERGVERRARASRASGRLSAERPDDARARSSSRPA